MGEGHRYVVVYGYEKYGKNYPFLEQILFGWFFYGKLVGTGPL
jgi:hypothetical protein